MSPPRLRGRAVPAPTAVRRVVKPRSGSTCLDPVSATRLTPRFAWERSEPRNLDSYKGGAVRTHETGWIRRRHAALHVAAPGDGRTPRRATAPECGRPGRSDVRTHEGCGIG
ncbi:hypothetical protein LBMAG56_21220 [Verrucomicrobiota bacterium]|nr:hypothetical protein LBMAG56_21220 [Verrucomicrobiota bacterium]